MNILQWTIAACAAVALSPAHAGVVLQAQMSGQPLMNTKDGAIEGCGVRIVAISEATQPNEAVRLADVSFNAVNPGYGMIKGGLRFTTLGKVLENKGLGTKTAQVPIKGLWLRPIGGAMTRLAGGKVSPSPATPGSVLYVAGLEETLAVFVAVLEKRPIQIGFDLPNDAPQIILAGTVSMPDGELAQVADCVVTWGNQPAQPK